jgi:hypothetical protein
MSEETGETTETPRGERKRAATATESADDSVSGPEPDADTTGEGAPSVVAYVTSPAGVEQVELYLGLYALVGVGVGVVGLLADAVASGVVTSLGGSQALAGPVVTASVTAAVILSVNVLAVGLSAVVGLRVEEELFEMDLRGVYGVAAAATGLGALVMGTLGGVLGGGGNGTVAAVTAAVVAGLVAAVVGAGAVWLTTSPLVRDPDGPPAVDPEAGDGSVTEFDWPGGER